MVFAVIAIIIAACVIPWLVELLSDNGEYVIVCIVVVALSTILMKGCSAVASTISVSVPEVTSEKATPNTRSQANSRSDSKEIVSTETEPQDAQPITANTKSLVAGSDIATGIYKLIANNTDSSKKIVKLYEPDGQILIGKEEFRNSVYIEVHEGQRLEYTEDLKIESIFEVEPTRVGSCHYTLDGWYLVGLDIPAGKYTIYQATSNYGMYFAFDSAEFPRVSKANPISGCVYDYQADVIQIYNNQFIEFINCEVFVDPSDGTHGYVASSVDSDGQATPSRESEQTVYITESGHRYHRNRHCTGLNNANDTYTITLSDAKKRGFTPCKRCY